MVYVEGFIVAVPVANKAAYVEHATKLAPMLKECGVQRMVECWGDDVPDGKVTDFRRSVQAKEGEIVVFAWFEYPSRRARDTANETMRNDPRMQPQNQVIPFDTKRMIFSGFEAIVEEGTPGKRGYVDGFVVPVPKGKKEAYREFAARFAPLFREYGATRVVEAWGDDVTAGKVTDFFRTVQATPDETVVYSWIEWSSKSDRDVAWKKLMADERTKPDHANTPFDGKRMIYGGFTPIIDL